MTKLEDDAFSACIKSAAELAKTLKEQPMSYRIEAATKEEWAERALSGEKKLDDLKDSIKELFSLLDVTEETDEGRVHRPVQIVCVRSDMLMKLENVLATLKSTIEDKK